MINKKSKIKSTIPELTDKQKASSKIGKVGQHQLHILSKKSWHVWNKDNIERVERDEKLYQENQKLSLYSHNKNKKEISINKLRSKMGTKNTFEVTKHEDKDGHCNFFFVIIQINYF